MKCSSSDAMLRRGKVSVIQFNGKKYTFGINFEILLRLLWILCDFFWKNGQKKLFFQYEIAFFIEVSIKEMRIIPF